MIHNAVLIKENLKKELSKPIQTDQDDLIVVSQKALTHLISSCGRCSCGINVHHESQIRALHITYTNTFNNLPSELQYINKYNRRLMKKN